MRDSILYLYFMVEVKTMITLYAIKHKENGRFVTGTDFNYSPPRQILSDYDSPLLLTGDNVLNELKRRHVNLRTYKVCVVTVKEVT